MPLSRITSLFQSATANVYSPSANTVAIRTSSTDRLTLDSSGNVGIGTSSPATQLQVTNSANTGATVRLSSSATSMDNGTLGTLDWYSNDSSTGGTGQKGYVKVLDDTGFGQNYAMTFGTGYVTGGATAISERMRIDSSGNLGLGVTPSAWDSTYRIFQIGGNPVISSDDEALALVGNAYFNSGWKYITSGRFAAYYEVNKANAGVHAWYNAPSGTAGNAITFTQAMTLDASGNLLLGGTSQSGTANRGAVFSANKFGLAIIDTSSYATGVGGALNLGGNYRVSGDAQAFCRVEALKENATDGNYAYAMAFSTTPNGGTFTERARITSGGDFYIGQTTVTSPPTTGADVLAGGLVINPTRRTTASAANCNWDATTGNFARSTSSLRYKKDVEDANFGLADVLRLRAVTYKGKAEADGDKVFSGFIAEEIDEIGLDVFVEYDSENNPDSLAYPNMVALLAKAIQELNAKVEAQAAEIVALKGNA